MQTIIKSKNPEIGTLVFWMPHDGGYVRLESDGRSGTLAPQICEGGGFMGSTISATPENFKAVCRKWYREHKKLVEQYQKFI